MEGSAGQIQHIRSGPNPHVIGPGGIQIPIPTQVRVADGSTVQVTPQANIRVTGSESTHYYVEINIPSRLSGDGRMVLCAAGFGTAQGAGVAAARRGGFGRILTWLAGQTVGRVAAFVVGVFTPNSLGGQRFIRTQLENGARIIYCVIY